MPHEATTTAVGPVVAAHTPLTDTAQQRSLGNTRPSSQSHPLRSPAQPASAEGAYVCFARACACARTCARAHRETLLGAGRSLESAHVVAALSREPLLNDQGHMVSALLRSSSFRCTPEAIHPRTPRRFAWELRGTVQLAIQITAVRTLSSLRLAFQETRCTFSGTLSVV
jgi:hypothetical protein